jgi:hypothetical protein
MAAGADDFQPANLRIRGLSVTIKKKGSRAEVKFRHKYRSSFKKVSFLQFSC